MGVGVTKGCLIYVELIYVMDHYKNAMALIVDIYDTNKNDITRRNIGLNVFVSKFSALVCLVFLTQTLNKMPIYIKNKYPAPRPGIIKTVSMSDKLTQIREA